MNTMRRPTTIPAIDFRLAGTFRTWRSCPLMSGHWVPAHQETRRRPGLTPADIRPFQKVMSRLRIARMVFSWVHKNISEPIRCSSSIKSRSAELFDAFINKGMHSIR
jgi:hypothetical protein